MKNEKMENTARTFFKYFSLLVFLLTALVFPSTASAVCPVCTVAVGAGLGLSRYLGIDDAISGIWIGGLTLSISFWLVDWLQKKRGKPLNSIYQLLTVVFMYSLVFVPLYLADFIGDPFNTILGVDKILFGTVIGSVVFLFGMWADRKERKVKGKQLFNYQKVVFPVISLVLTSLLVYYYGGYLY